MSDEVSVVFMNSLHVALASRDFILRAVAHNFCYLRFFSCHRQLLVVGAVRQEPGESFDVVTMSRVS